MLTADRLAQLVERRTTVREISGSSTQGVKMTVVHEYTAFAMTFANG